MIFLKFLGCLLFILTLKLLLLLLPTLLFQVCIAGVSGKMIFKNRKSSLLSKIFPLELLPCRSVSVCFSVFQLHIKKIVTYHSSSIANGCPKFLYKLQFHGSLKVVLKLTCSVSSIFVIFILVVVLKLCVLKLVGRSLIEVPH